MDGTQRLTDSSLFARLASGDGKVFSLVLVNFRFTLPQVQASVDCKIPFLQKYEKTAQLGIAKIYIHLIGISFYFL